MEDDRTYIPREPCAKAQTVMLASGDGSSHCIDSESCSIRRFVERLKIIIKIKSGREKWRIWVREAARIAVAH
jgi:hypothetical protein